MASFAHLAYVLQRAADIMLGDHDLDLNEALALAIWGQRPTSLIDVTDSEMDDLHVARRVIDIQCSGAVIFTRQARSAARHMAELFHRIDHGGGRPGVEDDDPDTVAQLMWEQAHGLELARCP
ncbi:hypothetical protein ACIBQ1_38180 [Nonomuraea sp. NPDC050153]|uniref:hypothetical protein n=1 Tax=Nonomuraea sp. NPDC050153 TaxID=3364359 RepID=UPI0037951E0A